MVQLSYQWASLVAQMIKNLPTIWETQIHALVWEDVLENLTLTLIFFLWQGVATHSSILAWRIPRTEKLAGYSPWDCKQLDMTERLTLLHFHFSHIHTWILENPYLWLYGPLLAKWSLLFNMLSRLVITFLPRSKCLLILWLQSPSAVIWETKKLSQPLFPLFPVYLPWSDGTRCHDLCFLNVDL